MVHHNLNRFLDAQESQYQMVINEIKKSRKRTHWMWLFFPQITGLGFSETSKFYAINDFQEATDFLNHKILGTRLVYMSELLLEIKNKTVLDIFGSPDNLKLNSCMTLFGSVPNASIVFEKVIDQYFNGIPDHQTLQIIKSL
ncbi:MAG: DUF1810 domain-containing protein [Flavobacterium sp.]|nr:DUF1810 domain-containing protein [Pedobacter sp.]